MHGVNNVKFPLSIKTFCFYVILCVNSTSIQHLRKMKQVKESH
jgi:hypothetical protein